MKNGKWCPNGCGKCVFSTPWILSSRKIVYLCDRCEFYFLKFNKDLVQIGKNIKEKPLY